MILSFSNGCRYDCTWNVTKVVDLSQLQAQGRILFVPTGGGNFDEWAVRFRGLACREFHLYDRESAPETERRESAVELVNGRSDCRGFMTAKRSLENYLHPRAIAQAGGGDIVVRDDECVGTVLARHWYELIPQRELWSIAACDEAVGVPCQALV